MCPAPNPVKPEIVGVALGPQFAHLGLFDQIGQAMFLGKGNSSLPEGLHEQIRAGAIGLKLHEDWGSMPAAI